MTNVESTMESDNVLYKCLLEATKAVPWKIDWQTMRFVYIGAQIERLLGWSVSSWSSADDWAKRIHPKDRDGVFSFCIAQSKAGVDHEADYRALTKDGGYVWIRDVVHVVRNESGDVEALVGFMFDITERKKLESAPKVTSSILRATFDLSPAEARVALLLAEGLSQKEIAKELNIQHDTVRKQLQTIYKKTSTNKQSQLVKLVLNLPSRFLPGLIANYIAIDEAT